MRILTRSVGFAPMWFEGNFRGEYLEVTIFRALGLWCCFGILLIL